MAENLSPPGRSWKKKARVGVKERGVYSLRNRQVQWLGAWLDSNDTNWIGLVMWSPQFGYRSAPPALRVYVRQFFPKKKQTAFVKRRMNGHWASKNNRCPSPYWIKFLSTLIIMIIIIVIITFSMVRHQTVTPLGTARQRELLLTWSQLKWARPGGRATKESLQISDTAF